MSEGRPTPAESRPVKGRWGRPVSLEGPPPRWRGGAGPAGRWGTPREAARLCVARSTLRRTLKIALIVGTLLSLINQRDVLLAGEANVLTWVRVLANYLIPWVVSSVGFLAATGSEPEVPTTDSCAEAGQGAPGARPQPGRATAGTRRA